MLAKLRAGSGGVWRIPPSFDGHQRSPLPRFTTLSPKQLVELDTFFQRWAAALVPVLVPGAHLVIASNPLVSFLVAGALAKVGLERRGEIIRLVMTMRGGDRPKNAHQEFPDVSVMPRSMFEPWLLFRKPLDGRVQEVLRKQFVALVHVCLASANLLKNVEAALVWTDGPRLMAVPENLTVEALSRLVRSVDT